MRVYTLLHSCTADIASVPGRGERGGERGRGGGGAAGPGPGRRAERETGPNILHNSFTRTFIVHCTANTANRFDIMK